MSNGAHDVCQPGYMPLGIKYANSWGRLLWGIGGIAVMPWDMYISCVLQSGDMMKLQDSLSANKALRRLLK
ncbi:MAG: hypothetical protein WB588_03220 [Dehalococcoidia bacterium]